MSNNPMPDYLIQERSEIIHDLISERIHGYGSYPPDFLDAFKATFALKTRSVSGFIRAFRETGTSFEISSVEAVYEDMCEHLPGFKGLSDDEKGILIDLLDAIDEVQRLTPIKGLATVSTMSFRR